LLTGCPVCGNSEIDATETCDDGNTANGDGCNSSCQNEKCVQQSVGPFPCSSNTDCSAPRTCNTQAGLCQPNLICDDNNFCTDDTCNTSLNGGTCQHVAKNCADAQACTTDSCNAVTGVCQHVGDNAVCDDSNVCTTNTCNPTTGCVLTNNNNACSDGNACTGDDACAGGVCTGNVIGGCAVCGDNSKSGDEQCDDGNATFVRGEYCGVDCVLIPCGKPTNSPGENPTSSDALFALRAAVGQVTCSIYVCDVTGDSNIFTSDALRILRKAVGQVVTLGCPTPP
jgi:cysteine-rich repeat protein